LVEEFEKHIDDNLSFLKRKIVLVACSGGVDSMVLVHLCHQLGIIFRIAHCNFGLRGSESDADENFVRSMAKSNEVPFFATSFETSKFSKTNKISIQMAARELRYTWFKQLAKEHAIDYILTGHHLNDTLETFLINLSRGTGIDGLTGIPEINDMYVRPLLPFSRNQILEFAKENNIKWREDSSNSDTKYIRNKIRHLIIPELKEIHPTFLQNFETSIGYLKQTNTFIKNQINSIKKEVFEYIETDTIKISVDTLKEYDDPKTYLFFLLKEYGFTAWNDIEHILTAQSGKQIFSSTHRLIKNRDSEP